MRYLNYDPRAFAKYQTDRTVEAFEAKAQSLALAAAIVFAACFAACFVVALVLL